MTAIAKRRKLGSQFDPQTEQGPQISKIQLEVHVCSLHTVLLSDCMQYQRVLGYIELGKQQGAKVHIGGEQYGKSGYFVQPTIFTDVKADMRIAQEEIFGPVAIVVKFKTDEGYCSSLQIKIVG
jgi:aldehyde dehydrogenase (NAD+)